MSDINPQLEAALTGFARQPGITPNQAAQLRTTITQDTQLLNRLRVR